MDSQDMLSRQSWREHKEYVEPAWVLCEECISPPKHAIDLKEMKHQEDGSIAHSKG